MATVALVRPAAPWFAAPVVLCAAMLFVSGVIWSLGGSSPADTLWIYFSGAFAATVTSVALFAFIEIVKLANTKADRPIPTVIAKIKPRLPILAIPALVLPLFLSGYTAAKSSISTMVGFRYDRLFADVDAAIFGTDPWQITHAFIGPLGTLLIEFFYVPVWIAVLAYSKAMVGVFAAPRFALTFYTATLLTWLIGGFVMAYLLTAAGPAFTDLNGMEWRFVEIRASLLSIAGVDSPFISGPAYLMDGIGKDAYAAGGISAMPSMHIAACTLYCLAARGTRWFIPALAFLAIIFVGSIHSGYHYAVDAPVAVSIAYVCWKLSERYYDGAVVLK